MEVNCRAGQNSYRVVAPSMNEQGLEPRPLGLSARTKSRRANRTLNKGHKVKFSIYCCLLRWIQRQLLKTLILKLLVFCSSMYIHYIFQSRSSSLVK
jgi:hypothetical protein